MGTPLGVPFSVTGGLGEDGQVSELPASFPLILILIGIISDQGDTSLLIEAHLLLPPSIFFLFFFFFWPIPQQRIQGAKHTVFYLFSMQF